MSLTSKQRAFLKKAAHDLNPIVRVGKEGYNENLIKSILDAIEKRELIKVKILQNSEVDKKEVAFKLAEESGCELVGIIGRTIILYKRSEDFPTISEELKKV